MAASPFTLEASADLPGATFTTMRQMVLSGVKTSDLVVIEDKDRHMTIETANGLIGLRPGQTTETAGLVAARDAQKLFALKNMVVNRIFRSLPDLAEAIRWSDGQTDVGALPPNFRLAEVCGVEAVGPDFLRVTLQGEDLSNHGDDAIHFRLVQPPAGQPPAWPSLAPNGAIKWPAGDDAPHRPVYTTRRVDRAANRIVTDVFIHEGGRTTEWARELLSGGRTRSRVGILGPSGGGLMSAGQILFGADETGFPAAARILENLPAQTTGHVYLESENGSDSRYPINAPAGVAITWLSRARGDVLCDACLRALPDHGDSRIWFAGERSQASRMRQAAKAAGRDPRDLRISAFWTG